MNTAKVFVVVACVFLNIVVSKPHTKRHERNSDTSNEVDNKNPYQPLPGYQQPSYQPLPGYQPPSYQPFPMFQSPPYQSPYGFPPQPPMGIPPMYSPFPNPYYMNYQFNPFMSMYSPYPLYPQYPPLYQPYPFQTQQPNYQDPFAHIPSEIIDVDSYFPGAGGQQPKFEVQPSDENGESQRNIKTSNLHGSGSSTDVKSEGDKNPEEKVEEKTADADADSGEPCPSKHFRLPNGTCFPISKNVISVPGRCPKGQNVNAKNECVPEFQ